jgi:hypothetical protein
MVWSFFKLSHGKGVHDGAGVVLKQKIQKEQMNMESKTQLQCAIDVVFLCSRNQSKEHVAYPNERRNVIQFFHLVNLEDVNCRSTYDYKNIHGSRSIHSFSSISHIDVTLLNM